VLVAERDVTELPPRDRNVAMVFQSYALYPHLSVKRNLAFGLRVRRRPRTEVERKVAAVAGQLQLSELLERRPKQLSGGQRQRVALGRAMVRDPVAFLMDEPLSNLDAQLRTATRLELTELHRSLGTTFVYVTHDQVEAMTMATRIAVLNQGHLEQVGTPEQVYDAPATTFVAGFIGAPPMNLLAATASTREGRVHVHAQGIEAHLWEGAVPERPVIVGVRPEQLEVGSALTTGGAGEDRAERVARFDARVVAVENLGSEEVALCEVGGTRVAARGARPLRVATGDHVQLRAPADAVTLFDADSGRRLQWVPDPENSAAAAVPPALTA
jgi:multiple sugar transport system ATP-binding protein